MDPITAAIVAALTAGATAAGPKVAEKVIVEAYEGLKALLKRKFGGESQVVEAVQELEAKPDSQGRQTTLKEEVAAAMADQDPDLLQAAQAVLDQIAAQPGGQEHIQQAIGSYIAQADRGSTASVNVNQPREQ